MIRPLAGLVPALVVSCLALCVLAMALAALLHLDPVRADVTPALPYLPGADRPSLNCYDSWEYAAYGFYWWCRIAVPQIVYVSGADGRINTTTLVLSDARVGDVLAAMGAPSRIVRYRNGVTYEWADGGVLATGRRGLRAAARYVTWRAK